MREIVIEMAREGAVNIGPGMGEDVSMEDVGVDSVEQMEETEKIPGPGHKGEDPNGLAWWSSCGRWHQLQPQKGRPFSANGKGPFPALEAFKGRLHM
ncbi:hypothetical protein PAAG_03264 [Paracoccidioides lutzii Pb01]|uniref:Uncharacterized protein n=1 Tax=Paracoccidioides lutzii (strain ATCC MYA-826 / Pb01) TaxID=502779 RepID=C1GXY1_PARBA|nr:hypothetical protein PAAG_03264 [Paracoccidioides lutzii Pb01]EEH41701.1 hypothetical protein PAAG_03264 [Paracoccidioides lutzii Pb01]